MKEWDIRVLFLGKITADLTQLWPQMNPPLEESFELSAPYLGFLLRSGDDAIVVDTGINEKYIVDGKAWGQLSAEGGASYLEKALSDEGLKPEDIRTVILTHLHNDHAGNCHIFNNARVVIQRDEWLNLLNPYPHQLVRNDYDQGIIEELRAMKILLVEGDIELEDGIQLYKVPGGHSLGHQVVVVSTKKGRVVLIGDVSLFYWQFFPHISEIVDMEGKRHFIPRSSPAYGPAVPHMITYDLFSFYDGVSKIRALASRDEPGFIIPGHEPSLVLTGI
jgi:glyoxylase-like metal-dependent hydrolase (beta-lactamase superfamily II)